MAKVIKTATTLFEKFEEKCEKWAEELF